MISRYEEGMDPKDLGVQLSEILVATSDDSDELISHYVPAVLKLVRTKMKMDVVFVSQFVDGERVFRHVDCVDGIPVISEGASDPLEETYCQRVVDGRMPRLAPNMANLPPETDVPKLAIQVGSYLSTPVILSDGKIYGTMCCFSAGANEDLDQGDLRNLEIAADLAARHIERTGAEH